MLTCEYIAHSGFIFETSKHILFFDVASGTIPAHYVNSPKEKTILFRIIIAIISTQILQLLISELSLHWMCLYASIPISLL